MFVDKVVLFSMLVIVLILSLSVTFAVDNETSDMSLSKNDQSNLIGTNNINRNMGNSFSKLSEKINTSSNSLVLDKNYRYSDNDFRDGIVFNKNDYVIDGKGHTIDANSKSRIFDVYGTNITLKNMILINSKHYGGSAIYINPKASVTTVNVTFKNCQATESGVVFVDSATYTSSSDKFINCKSKNEGIISTLKSNVIIKNDYMQSKHKLYKGFISSLGSSSISVTDSTFKNTRSVLD